MLAYSDSRNDVPRVAQRYGTIAAHTRRRASVLVMFVVFCVHMHNFAGLIRWTPPPTFSDTASPTATLIPLFSSSELTGCGYPGLWDRKNRSDMCPRWESERFFRSNRPGYPKSHFGNHYKLSNSKTSYAYDMFGQLCKLGVNFFEDKFLNLFLCIP